MNSGYLNYAYTAIQRLAKNEGRVKHLPITNLRFQILDYLQSVICNLESVIAYLRRAAPDEPLFDLLCAWPLERLDEDRTPDLADGCALFPPTLPLEGVRDERTAPFR